MSKSTVAKMWIGGLIVMIVGLVIGGVSLGLMFTYGGTYQPSLTGTGTEFVPNLNGVFWATLSFTILGFTVAGAGVILQLVAWIGALVNSYRLVDKTWFVVLLVGGLIGFGFPIAAWAVMIAYLLSKPVEPAAPTAGPPMTGPQYLPPLPPSAPPAVPPAAPTTRPPEPTTWAPTS
jgi:MFS family permease